MDDGTDGWKASQKMDDGIDGWKASRKRTTTSFNICNISSMFKFMLLIRTHALFFALHAKQKKIVLHKTISSAKRMQKTSPKMHRPKLIIKYYFTSRPL